MNDVGIDWFMAGLGIVKGEVSDDAAKVMIEAALAFLRVGKLSWLEWLTLKDHGRRAFLAASAILDAEQAQRAANTLVSSVDKADVEA